jgi:squalene-hopene/tetraprenyl-beta-curcumene cyclase
MVARIASLIALTAAAGLCGDWNPRLAADYLDARQKAWFAWPAANKGENGVCLSCHTGLTYLLARPALSHALGENAATPYETQLLDSIRKRVGKKTVLEFSPKGKEPAASQGLGVESVLSALLLASVDARAGAMSAETEQAFERMWALEIADGKNKGAWMWNSFDLDPWEEPDSMFYGAALAALAVGTTPASYQARPDIAENVTSLKSYLASTQRTQPIHNRLLLVWASTKLPGVLSVVDRKAILDQVIACQQPDGGWTLEAIGPWKAHANALPSTGSSSYATALVAFTLQQAGVSRKSPNMNRALNWLRSHQDPKGGFWDAQSMNKQYEPDSMPKLFMRDAATSFASLALVE